MAATIDTHDTKYGKVTTSGIYFSHLLGCKVKNLTLVKSENESNGWGVSRECPANLSLTPEFLNMFAREASQLM